MIQLNGKVAFITGVGAGIGRAAAHLFTQAGATVWGVDRDQEAGASLTHEVEGYPGKFDFFAADLATEAGVEAAVRECYQRHDRIDVLYNNAGISVVEPFTQMAEATLERVFAINFMAVLRLCQRVIPPMQQQGGGVIINTASELAIVAQPLFSAYCASKGAVLSLTRSLALEYARDNIRINALCPGPIDTGMLRAEFACETDAAKAEQDSIATIPIGRLGQPEEIARVALFLASDEAPRLLHGASLLVDGGKTIF